MTDIIMLFASMSGNTEEMAEIIKQEAAEQGAAVTAYHIDFDEISMEELQNYDAILLGTYTWGDGDLPYEMEDLYDDLQEVDLTGKITALFGSCDSMYPDYGGAIHKFGDRFIECGANVVLDYLKVDLDPGEEDTKECKAFAREFVKKLGVLSEL
ncbi:flavodoxin [Halobacillus salinarum]|uniref:Flavodoxin n=1 Tax=Halobacillus salinarum TaxID=2932257 RepID=A0ABY4EMY1_9BACI|nr:flavodoxin [Halobacillus salinarum]UOQ45817.1 flavodoxin [Halobacillus salinarum]